MGRIGSVLRKFGRRARLALKSYKGPDLKIGIVGKNCLHVFKFLFYGKATPLQIGRRILRGAGEEHAVRSISIADLTFKPLILELGEKGSANQRLALYAVNKKGKNYIVVADVERASLEDMPFADLYIIKRGKYLRVGRSREMDLKTQRLFGSVSGHHLSILFPENSDQIYIVDHSTFGTAVKVLGSHKFRKSRPDIVPEKIKPSWFEV